MLKKLIGTAGIIMALTLPVSATELLDRAKDAENFADNGKSVDAILAMDAAVGKLWDKLPLTFIEALFVNERPTSYGGYVPRKDNVFRSGQDMILYTELAGFGYGRDGDHFIISLNADMEVHSAEGKVLAKREDFLKFNNRSRVPNREYFAVFVYNFDGIAPGNYTIRTQLRDQNSDRVSHVDTPIVVK